MSSPEEHGYILTTASMKRTTVTAVVVLNVVKRIACTKMLKGTVHKCYRVIPATFIVLMYATVMLMVHEWSIGHVNCLPDYTRGNIANKISKVDRHASFVSSVHTRCPVSEHQACNTFYTRLCASYIMVRYYPSMSHVRHDYNNYFSE